MILYTRDVHLRFLGMYFINHYLYKNNHKKKVSPKKDFLLNPL